MQIEEKLVRKIVREAVRETLTGIGFTLSNPRETQADLLYLRKIRKGSEYVSLRIKASLIAFLIPTLLYLLWEAFKSTLHR